MLNRFMKTAFLSIILLGCQPDTQPIGGNKYSYDRKLWLDFSLAKDSTIVVLHVRKNDSTKVIDLNTGTSNTLKWAAGFSPSEKTVILYSSDIGNRAWAEPNHWKEIKTTQEIDSIAEDFYKAKYGKYPHTSQR
jgi:hypothetical protein